MAGLYSQDRDDSLEAKIFRQHYAHLVSAIQDPESLADRLFSRNVIGRGLLQQVHLDSLTNAKKNRKLLSTIQEQLVVIPGKFTDVMEALQADSTLHQITAQLQYAYFTAKPKLEDLQTELRSVHGWVHLGLCLELPKHALKEIHAAHSSGFDALGKCKVKMLSIWLKTCRNPTWSILIAALQATRMWATASKIAFKYGVELPSKVLSKGKMPSQIEDVIRNAQQLVNVAALREEIEQIHTEFHQTEDDINQNEKEVLILDKELESMKERQGSNEQYMALLLKDKYTQQLELATKRDRLRELNRYTRQSPVPEGVRKQLQQMQGSITSLERKLDEMELMVNTARQVSSEITQQLHLMNLKIDAIADDFNSLQHKKRELLQKMQKYEHELDTCLLGRNTSTPYIPDMADVAYYNIMLCAGRVEVKLHQSELEECERKLEQNRREFDSLKDSLKQQQQKEQELEEHLQKSQKRKAHASSSEYQYPYMHLCTNEMQEYETEHLLSKLRAENLGYKMQLARIHSKMYILENQRHALIQEVAVLKDVHGILLTKIEKPTPRPRPRNTETQVSSSASAQQKEDDVRHYETIQEVTQRFSSELKHTSGLGKPPAQQEDNLIIEPTPRPKPKPRPRNTGTKASPSVNAQQKEGDVGHYETIPEVTQSWSGSELQHTSRLEKDKPLKTKSPMLKIPKLKWPWRKGQLVLSHGGSFNNGHPGSPKRILVQFPNPTRRGSGRVTFDEKVQKMVYDHKQSVTCDESVYKVESNTNFGESSPRFHHISIPGEGYPYNHRSRQRSPIMLQEEEDGHPEIDLSENSTIDGQSHFTYDGSSDEESTLSDNASHISIQNSPQFRSPKEHATNLSSSIRYTPIYSHQQLPSSPVHLVGPIPSIEYHEPLPHAYQHGFFSLMDFYDDTEL